MAADRDSDVGADSASPGWYPTGQSDGLLRYWDGSRWTDHTATDPSAQDVAVPNGGTGPPAAHGAAVSHRFASTRYGRKMSQGRVDRALELLEPALSPAEVVWLIVRANRVSPMAEFIAVSSARVLTVAKPEGVTQSFWGDHISDCAVGRLRIYKRMLTLEQPGAPRAPVADVIHDEDTQMLIAAVRHLASQNNAAAVRAELPAELIPSARTALVDESRTILIGKQPKPKVWKHVEQVIGGQTPILVWNEGWDGILVITPELLGIFKTSAFSRMQRMSVAAGYQVFDRNSIVSVRPHSAIMQGAVEVVTANTPVVTAMDWEMDPYKADPGRSPMHLMNVMHTDSARANEVAAVIGDVLFRGLYAEGYFAESEHEDDADESDDGNGHELEGGLEGAAWDENNEGILGEGDGTGEGRSAGGNGDLRYLSELRDMWEAGVLTREEFDAAKRRLLNLDDD